MSKSLGEKHYINLFGDEKSITKQVKSAVTDSGENPAGQMSPGVKNLFELLKACDEMDAYHYNMAQWEAGNLQYGSLKGDVAKALVELTGKFRQNLESIRQNEAEVKEKVLQSSARIRLRAQKTMAEVREITGLTTLWH